LLQARFNYYTAEEENERINRRQEREKEREREREREREKERERERVTDGHWQSAVTPGAYFKTTVLLTQASNCPFCSNTR